MPDHTAEHLPTHCRICASAAIRVFYAREMMFGTREVFQYFECTDCGCVQILSYPDDIARQYPKEYYCGVADRTDQARHCQRPVKVPASADSTGQSRLAPFECNEGMAEG